jgi:hypothetical protein
MHSIIMRGLGRFSDPDVAIRAGERFCGRENFASRAQNRKCRRFPFDFLGRKCDTSNQEYLKMTTIAERLGASKAASCLLVLFIPSKDRTDEPIDQEFWVQESLNVLGTFFGGATAFPQGKGVWRDDAQGGRLLFDQPVVIQCYTSEVALAREASALREFLYRMGRDAKQGAVGLVIDRDYLEISFPFDTARPAKKKKRK